MRKCAAVCLALGALRLWAQEQTPVFRSTSELVLLDAQVLNTKTRAPAPLLKDHDFEISEHGVPQAITFFSHDEIPLSVVLLFDLTDSSRAVLKRLAEGSVGALGHLKNTDEAAVMTYSAHASVVDGFTTDRARTAHAIETAAGMTSDEPAHFNEAVYQAVMQLRKGSQPGSRRVVIWLTDNLPNVPYRKEYPAHTEAEALRVLNEDGVVVAPILLRNPLWSVFGMMVLASEARYEKEFPPGNARKYAELTGGQAVGLRGKQPAQRLAQLIDELRARYTIGFRPSEAGAPGTFCSILVELAASAALRPKEWVVLTRKGYYRQ